MFSTKLEVSFDHLRLQENPEPNFIPESSFVSMSFPKHPGPSRGVTLPLPQTRVPPKLLSPQVSFPRKMVLRPLGCLWLLKDRIVKVKGQGRPLL